MALTTYKKEFRRELMNSIMEKDIKKTKIMIKGQGLDFLWDDVSPLMLACSQEKLIALNMIHHGLDLNLENSRGQTALFYACQKGDFELIEKLHKLNGFKKLEDNIGETILHYATHSNSKQVMNFLLEVGIDPNVRNNQNKTPLHYAAWHENPEICEVLIKRGALVNALDIDNKPPILYSSNLKTIKLLLEYNAQLLISGSDTLIHNLVSENKYEEVKFLHDFLGKRNVEKILGPNKCNPLLYAVFNNNYELTKYLIEKNYEVNVSNKMGLTPLMRAVENNNLGLVKLLIENNADVSIKNKKGENVFLIACKHNNLKMVKYLHEFYKEIDVKDNYLHTPLMWAAMYKYDDICDFLIENNADHTLKNKFHKTAMDLAEEVGSKYFKKEVWIY
jgi:uncharacterized protein